MQPLVYEVDDISKGFFADYTRKRRDADAIFHGCDYRLFNLKRLSLEVFHRLFREPYPEPIIAYLTSNGSHLRFSTGSFGSLILSRLRRPGFPRKTAGRCMFTKS